MIDINELTALAARLEASHGGAPCMASQALKDAAGAVASQAEELANYKQLATTAIDDAVALRAQLAALQCGAKMVPLTDEQILNIHAMRQWPRTMFADKGYGIALDTVTVKDFTRAIEAAHGIKGETK